MVVPERKNSMDYNVLLHPYRFLIVAALGEKDASTRELQRDLPNIPQATLYRNIQKLEETKIIKRVSEKKVRGAIEVTYGLNFSMKKMELEDVSVETYLNAAYTVFFAYVHNKLTKHMTEKSDENSSLTLSKFNTMKVQIKEDMIGEFSKATEELIMKYSCEQGKVYQLTTFLVPEAKGGK
jgi:DNA-binding MarR family transcriptional regulator